MTLKIEKVAYDAQVFIGIHVPYNDTLSREQIKTIDGRTWHPQEKLWLVPYNIETFQKLKNVFGNKMQLPTSRDARAIVAPYVEHKIPLKPEYQNKENNPLWDELRRKQNPTPSAMKDNAVSSAQLNAPIEQIQAPLSPQDTAKQFFASDSLEALLAVHNGTEPTAQEPKPVKDKITVRLAQFWKGYLRLDCYYRVDWVTKLKQINGHRWHKEHNCWTLPHSPLVIDILNKMFGDTLQYDLLPLTESLMTEHSKPKTQNLKLEIPPQYKDEITRLEEKMTLKRMAISTIKLYKNCFTQFLFYYNDKDPKDITQDEITRYMLHRIKDDKISPTVQNNFINAIKCYYEFVLGRDRTYYDLQRPKVPFQLPNVLSHEEAVKLFQAVDNVKHRCILLAIYSAGLRLSELVNLRIADIRRDDKSIFVKAGKGKKDRYTMLSDKLTAELDNYFQHYTPSYWLFEGQTGGQYSVRSVQAILRDAVAKSGVNPYATVHTLRHSFATHLILSGIDTIALQKLLGHESPVTTEIYVHLSHQYIKQIQSPLDKLNF
jgi:integrase/recombinase XerD